MAEPLLFGVETEWFNAHFSPGPAANPENVAAAALHTLRNKPHLPDERHGMFLADGSRVMVDCGHLEHATGECTDPAALVSYIKSFERILLRIAPETAEALGGGQVVFGRLNVDYASGATYGQHESYLTRYPPSYFEKALVPHLISRVVYTGEGGLALEGTGLAVSPRLLAFTRVAALETTSDRPIFNLRNETLASNGFFRLHLISGSTLGSELALYLKVGFTSLVVRAAELLGERMADLLQLAEPVSALHRVAADVTCKERLQLAGGGNATAIEIQREYLALVRRVLGQLPPWAPQVCDRLESTLDALSDDPRSMSRSLDWAIKYRIYTAQQSLSDSEDLGSDLLARLYGAAQRTAYGNERPPLSVLLGPSSPVLTTVACLNEELVKRGLRWEAVRADDAGRARMAEIDTRFGWLGDGIFDQLDRRGLLDHKVIHENQIQRAAASPPSGSRARLRGEVINRLFGKSAAFCNWEAVFDQPTGKALDLRNPWEAVERWRQIEEFNQEAESAREAALGFLVSEEFI